MSTRGYLKAGNEYYFIQSDAYQDFARPTLTKALKLCKNDNHLCVIRHANQIAGFDWIMKNEPADKEFRENIFCEYGWEIFPKSDKLKLRQTLTHKKVGNKIKFYQKVGNKMIHIKGSDMDSGRIPEKYW